jgi:hypothetical protein
MTPYDIIIIWQNTKAYYCSFVLCINSPNIKKIKEHRDVLFTDIGILSLAKFWLVQEWNMLYPNIRIVLNSNNEYVVATNINKQHIDFLWTPNLQNPCEGATR